MAPGDTPYRRRGYPCRIMCDKASPSAVMTGRANRVPAGATQRCAREAFALFRLDFAGWHRLTGALLCFLLALPLLAPIAAFAENGRNDVCCCKGECHCRYCKKHHHGAQPTDSGPGFDSPVHYCPCCPDQLPPQSLVQYAPAAACPVGALAATRANALPQTEARHRYTCIRVRQKRGPPTLSIAI